VDWILLILERRRSNEWNLKAKGWKGWMMVLIEKKKKSKRETRGIKSFLENTGRRGNRGP
jgi:hypothetical protein